MKTSNREMRPETMAAALSAIAPAILLSVAVAMQELLNLTPCHMCLQQRTALWTAFALGLGAVPLTTMRLLAGRLMTAGSAAATLVSGGIALHQLGGERGWWVLNTPCASGSSKAATLEDIVRMPVVRCDVPQWSLHGATMADLNAVACLVIATTTIVLLAKGKKQRSNVESKLPVQEET